MNGISTQPRHNPSNIQNAQSVDLPPQQPANPARDGHVKAQFVDRSATVNTNQVPHLAEPSVSLNPSSTKVAVNSLTRASSNYFRFPEKDAIALADRALIESLQDRLRANRDKQAMQNTLAYQCSEAQSDSQKDEGKEALWSSVVACAASVTTAFGGMCLETAGNVQQYKGETGVSNVETLPKAQAEFDALAPRQQTEMQRIDNLRTQTQLEIDGNVNPFEGDAVNRLEALGREKNSLILQHAGERRDLRNNISDLTAKVAALPLDAAKGLMNTGKNWAVRGSVIQRNVAQGLDQIAQSVGKNRQQEQQSISTMASARANLLASMAQETGKEADSDNNQISQIIEAINKRSDMTYNTVNFFTQKIV